LGDALVQVRRVWVDVALIDSSQHVTDVTKEDCWFSSAAAAEMAWFRSPAAETRP
jgi:hypothetical protein